jgi:hypothetical protein
MAKIGARDSFARAEEDLGEHSGIHLGVKDVERIAGAIGADIGREEQGARAKAMAAYTTGPMAVLSLACDGTGVLLTRKETADPRGKQIDDLYHAYEHLYALLKLMFPPSTL